jgi:hypothetical protein
MRTFTDELHDLESGQGENSNGEDTSVSTASNTTSTSSSRSHRKVYDYDSCRSFVFNKVLSENATVDFNKVYRISRERFQAIHDDIKATGNMFFLPLVCPLRKIFGISQRSTSILSMVFLEC